MRILLAEDNAVNQRVAVSLLANGDAVCNSGSFTLTPPSLPDYGFSKNVRFARTGMTLSNAGLVSDLITYLPSGMGWSSSPLRKQLVEKGLNPKILNSVVENLPIANFTTKLKLRKDLDFTAGDTEVVAGVLRRLAAMRSYMRDINLGRDTDESIATAVGPDRYVRVGRYPDVGVSPRHWYRMHHRLVDVLTAPAAGTRTAKPSTIEIESQLPADPSDRDAASRTRPMARTPRSRSSTRRRLRPWNQRCRSSFPRPGSSSRRGGRRRPTRW